MKATDGKRVPPSPTRIGIWVLVSAVGLYMLVSGVLAALGVVS